MNIIDDATAQYQQKLQAQKAQDPLASLASAVGLKINSPQAAQKLRAMGDAVAQQAAQGAQVQQADAVDKATSAWKQSFFAGKV